MLTCQHQRNQQLPKSLASFSFLLTSLAIVDNLLSHSPRFSQVFSQFHPLAQYPIATDPHCGCDKLAILSRSSTSIQTVFNPFFRFKTAELPTLRVVLLVCCMLWKYQSENGRPHTVDLSSQSQQ
ncbi:hypothetical protein VTI74DRAFT_4886 [Chaetomium olivicolor]